MELMETKAQLELTELMVTASLRCDSTHTHDLFLSLVVGAQGANGEPGAQGATSVIGEGALPSDASVDQTCYSQQEWQPIYTHDCHHHCACQRTACIHTHYRQVVTYPQVYGGPGESVDDFNASKFDLTVSVRS